MATVKINIDTKLDKLNAFKRKAYKEVMLNSLLSLAGDFGGMRVARLTMGGNFWRELRTLALKVAEEAVTTLPEIVIHSPEVQRKGWYSQYKGGLIGIPSTYTKEEAKHALLHEMQHHIDRTKLGEVGEYKHPERFYRDLDELQFRHNIQGDLRKSWFNKMRKLRGFR